MFTKFLVNPKSTIFAKSITPEEIRQRLIAHYQKCLKIKRLFYPEVEIERQFVDLAILEEAQQLEKVQQLSRVRQTDADTSMEHFDYDEQRDLYTSLWGEAKKPVLLNNIMTQCHEANKKVLLLGAAGVGKTTLSQYFLQEWSYSRWGKEYKWIFRIALRNFTADRYSQQTVPYEILDVLLKECLDEITLELEEPLSLLAKESLSQELAQKEKEGAILWILDGYDEIAEDIPSHLDDLLKQLVKTNHLILTSRPYNLQGLVNQHPFSPGLRLEITGFSPPEVTQYIQKFFSNLKEEEKGETLLRFINSNLNIAGSCRIPINLELVCSAWQQQPFDKTFLSMSELYHKVMISLCMRYLGKFKKEAVEAYFEEEVLEKCSEAISFLDYFAHLTLRDFFAARYLCACMQASLSIELEKRVSIFPHIWKDQLNIRDYIIAHQYDAHFEIIWWFIAGLLAIYQDSRTLLWFFNILLNEKEDLTNLYTASLLLRCLDETNDFINILPNTMGERLLGPIQTWCRLLTDARSIAYHHPATPLPSPNPFWERFKLSRWVFQRKGMEDFFIQQLSSSDPKVVLVTAEIFPVIRQHTPKIVDYLLKRMARMKKPLQVKQQDQRNLIQQSHYPNTISQCAVNDPAILFVLLKKIKSPFVDSEECIAALSCLNEIFCNNWNLHLNTNLQKSLFIPNPQNKSIEYQVWLDQFSAEYNDVLHQLIEKDNRDNIRVNAAIALSCFLTKELSKLANNHCYQISPACVKPLIQLAEQNQLALHYRMHAVNILIAMCLRNIVFPLLPHPILFENAIKQLITQSIWQSLMQLMQKSCQPKLFSAILNNICGLIVQILLTQNASATLEILDSVFNLELFFEQILQEIRKEEDSIHREACVIALHQILNHSQGVEYLIMLFGELAIESLSITLSRLIKYDKHDKFLQTRIYSIYTLGSWLSYTFKLLSDNLYKPKTLKKELAKNTIKSSQEILIQLVKEEPVESVRLAAIVAWSKVLTTTLLVKERTHGLYIKKLISHSKISQAINILLFQIKNQDNESTVIRQAIFQALNQLLMQCILNHSFDDNLFKFFNQLYLDSICDVLFEAAWQEPDPMVRSGVIAGLSAIIEKAQGSMILESFLMKMNTKLFIENSILQLQQPDEATQLNAIKQLSSVIEFITNISYSEPIIILLDRVEIRLIFNTLINFSQCDHSLIIRITALNAINKILNKMWLGAAFEKISFLFVELNQLVADYQQEDLIIMLTLSTMLYRLTQLKLDSSKLVSMLRSLDDTTVHKEQLLILIENNAQFKRDKSTLENLSIDQLHTELILGSGISFTQLSLLSDIANNDKRLNVLSLDFALQSVTLREVLVAIESAIDQHCTVAIANLSQLFVQRCIRSSKALYQQNSKLYFYEGKKYVAFELDPKNRTMLLDALRKAFKSLTGCVSKDIVPDDLQQLLKSYADHLSVNQVTHQAESIPHAIQSASPLMFGNAQALKATNMTFHQTINHPRHFMPEQFPLPPANTMAKTLSSISQNTKNTAIQDNLECCLFQSTADYVVLRNKGSFNQAEQAAIENLQIKLMALFKNYPNPCEMWIKELISLAIGSDKQTYICIFNTYLAFLQHAQVIDNPHMQGLICLLNLTDIRAEWLSQIQLDSVIVVLKSKNNLFSSLDDKNTIKIYQLLALWKKLLATLKMKLYKLSSDDFLWVEKILEKCEESSHGDEKEVVYKLVKLAKQNLSYVDSESQPSWKRSSIYFLSVANCQGVAVLKEANFELGVVKATKLGRIASEIISTIKNKYSNMKEWFDDIEALQALIVQTVVEQNPIEFQNIITQLCSVENRALNLFLAQGLLDIWLSLLIGYQAISHEFVQKGCAQLFIYYISTLNNRNYEARLFSETMHLLGKHTLNVTFPLLWIQFIENNPKAYSEMAITLEILEGIRSLYKFIDNLKSTYEINAREYIQLTYVQKQLLLKCNSHPTNMLTVEMLYSLIDDDTVKDKSIIESILKLYSPFIDFKSKYINSSNFKNSLLSEDTVSMISVAWASLNESQQQVLFELYQQYQVVFAPIKSKEKTKISLFNQIGKMILNIAIAPGATHVNIENKAEGESGAALGLGKILKERVRDNDRQEDASLHNEALQLANKVDFLYIGEYVQGGGLLINTSKNITDAAERLAEKYLSQQAIQLKNHSKQNMQNGDDQQLSNSQRVSNQGLFKIQNQSVSSSSSGDAVFLVKSIPIKIENKDRFAVVVDSDELDDIDKDQLELLNTKLNEYARKASCVNNLNYPPEYAEIGDKEIIIKLIFSSNKVAQKLIDEINDIILNTNKNVSTPSRFN